MNHSTAKSYAVLLSTALLFSASTGCKPIVAVVKLALKNGDTVAKQVDSVPTTTIKSSDNVATSSGAPSTLTQLGIKSATRLARTENTEDDNERQTEDAYMANDIEYGYSAPQPVDPTASLWP